MPPADTESVLRIRNICIDTIVSETHTPVISPDPGGASLAPDVVVRSASVLLAEPYEAERLLRTGELPPSIEET